jgi:hypothetical protein
MARVGVALDRGSEPPSEVHHAPPNLILASEALREEVAPLEPGRGAGRAVTGAVGLSLALLGLALRGGIGPMGAREAASLSFAAAGAAIALAAFPLPYAVRAAAVAALGVVLMLLGEGGFGPVAGLSLGSGPGTDLARLVVLAMLPGALLFRARYRAYPRARGVLALALGLSLPFAVSRGLVAFGPGAPFVDRAGAALDMAVILSGLFGFMDENTTGGGSVWAALVLAILSGDIALRELAPASYPHPGPLAHVATALGTLCASVLAATSAYHLLAAWFARDARRQARRRVRASTRA